MGIRSPPDGRLSQQQQQRQRRRDEIANSSVTQHTYSYEWDPLAGRLGVVFLSRIVSSCLFSSLSPSPPSLVLSSPSLPHTRLVLLLSPLLVHFCALSRARSYFVCFTLGSASDSSHLSLSLSFRSPRFVSRCSFLIYPCCDLSLTLSPFLLHSDATCFQLLLVWMEDEEGKRARQGQLSSVCRNAKGRRGVHLSAFSLTSIAIFSSFLLDLYSSRHQRIPKSSALARQRARCRRKRAIPRSPSPSFPSFPPLH